MKLIVALALAGFTAGCMAEAPAPVSTRADARLDAALEGRTAGQPVDCVSQRDLRGNRTTPDGAIIFEAAGDVVYLNRPAGGCPGLGPGRTLVTRTISSRLCRGDIVTVTDPVAHIEYGGCGLGAFTPYRRVR